MPIAPGSLTQLPPNSTGPKLATGPTYSENSQTVQDEKVILGEQYLASYTVIGGGSTATANSHLLQIMAGATKPVRIRRIELHQFQAATTAATDTIRIVRLTTAGTGGGGIVPNALDPADGPAGFTCMTLPTVKGTEGVVMVEGQAMLWQTVGASFQVPAPVIAWDFDRPRSKPLIIAAGVTKGIAIKNVTAIANAGLTVLVWADEASWS